MRFPFLNVWAGRVARRQLHARLARARTVRPVAWLGRFKTTPAWALVIAAVNLLGIAYGFYYYLPQFRLTPAWLWPFVPDSPLAVLWAQLALAAYWLKRPSRTLDALAFVGNVQVGLWTVYVLLAYEPAFHTLDFFQGEGPLDLNTVLLAAHAGMALLGLVFVQGLRDARARDARGTWIAVGVAAAYYLVQDALDYLGPDFLQTGCGIRPYTVPCDAALELTLAIVTTSLTLAIVAWLVLLVRRET